MAAMRDFEAEAKDAVGRLLHHRTSAAPAAAAPQGETMSNLLADVKGRLHTILTDLETVDENAVGALVAAKSNPTVVSIVNVAASVAHLPDPDGLLSGAEAMLKAAASALQHAAQATAAADGTTAQPVATAATANVIR